MSQRSVVAKALANIEAAWEKIKTTPVHMGVEDFERDVLKQAKKYGIQYSQKKGKWLDIAKEAISDPRLSQGEKNLYLMETNPSELRSACRKFHKACGQLHMFVEWAYNDIRAFVDDSTKDQRLRTFLQWRVLPIAEAYQKWYKLNLRGKITKQRYLRLRPVTSLRSK